MQNTELRKKMIAYFCKAGDATLLKLTDKAALEDVARLFAVEQQQFNQSLPMYAQKEELLAALHNSQCIVLKGGTGIGVQAKFAVTACRSTAALFGQTHGHRFSISSQGCLVVSQTFTAASDGISATGYVSSLH